MSLGLKFLSVSSDESLNQITQTFQMAGFDNYHKIAVHDHVRVRDFPNNFFLSSFLLK